MGSPIGRQARIDALALIESGDEPCVPWAGRIDSQGYGTYGRLLAHRVVYTDVRGTIPEGLTLDHLCHNPATCPGGVTCPHRSCVNPWHLEPVTRLVNTIRGGGLAALNARKTHCIRGHEFNDVNTYRRKGYRICRACTAMHQRAYQARKRAAA